MDPILFRAFIQKKTKKQIQKNKQNNTVILQKQALSYMWNMEREKKTVLISLLNFHQNDPYNLHNNVSMETI